MLPVGGRQECLPSCFCTADKNVCPPVSVWQTRMSALLAISLQRGFLFFRIR